MLPSRSLQATPERAACRACAAATRLVAWTRQPSERGSGARIAVAVAVEQGRVLLTVQDSGPGLSPAEMARLGERFFRVLGNGQTGSGLGWSIVRRIAQATGAQVQVARSEALGGLQVRVSWTLYA